MEIQKAKHLHLELEKKKPNINYLYMVTEKIDGWYTYVDVHNGNEVSSVCSSAYRKIPSLAWCKKEIFNKLSSFTSQHPYRLIMEAHIPGKDFSETNGIFNRSKGDCDARDVEFVVHDLVMLGQPTPACERFDSAIFVTELLANPKVKPATLLQVSDNQDLWRMCFDSVIERGGEGIVLKQTSGLYQPGKRNSSLMKIKEEVDADLLCLDVYETFGDKGERNLNLLLKSKDNMNHTVRVSKHEDTALFDTDRGNVVGKVCKIKAMRRLKEGSYREPRFVCVRHDKLIIDID